MTAAVWIRGALQDKGVGLSTINWVEGDFEKPGPHWKANPKPLLRPVNRTPNETGKSLSQCLQDGEIAATIGAVVPSYVGKVAHIRHLFPDTRQATKKYHLQTKIFLIMHLVVIKKKTVDKYPFVVTSMFNALNDSKDLALRRMKAPGTHRYMLPFLPSYLEEIDGIFGGDPWPYGLEANRKSLEALVTYFEDQAMNTPQRSAGRIIRTHL
ncbi:hypothetical protein BDV33DRAFT_208310 [Aspergillus novoparasiticus]|uniref:SsuA/THI5-like domain-containing protein n=1 Tax=Aspergillus novoparasiticus TaxID=986946 RepID=A0A5N6EGE6_9EURO|nr:hypothetical protein BDV33DRAFT_208310 [Aspergillus novoparasiticus]